MPMICGTVGDYHEHFSVVKNVFGYRDGVHTAGAMNALLLPSGNTFIADTYVNDEPDAEELAEITLMAAETVRRFVLSRVWLCCRTPTLVLLTAVVEQNASGAGTGQGTCARTDD